MPWRVLFFALGVWLLQQCAVLPAPSLFVMLGAIGGALWFSRRRWHGLSIFGALLLGFVWAGSFAHWRLADALPAEWEGRDIEMTGIVAELPQKFERGVRFVFATEQANAPVPARIVLSWYRQVAPEDGATDAKIDGFRRELGRQSVDHAVPTALD